MRAILELLRTLLLRVPIEFVVALVRFLWIALLLVLVLLLRFYECVKKRLSEKDLYPEETKPPCGRIPEPVVRRPDPCLYSQRLLQSQGLSVTWNNPDIWIAPASDPSAIQPDSYHLEDDTDYIVTVRVHNASTDAAIGVRVRLNYRPWSFNSPDLTPVEIDNLGQEAVRFVNVPPMSAVPEIPGTPAVSPDLAQFKWHTPALAPGDTQKHYCLQASLYHPLDLNTANNMGQENTNVYRRDNPGLARPGETIETEVPLFNFVKRAQRFRIAADAYAIDTNDQFELHLKTTLGYRFRAMSARLANTLPTLRNAVATGFERAKVTQRRKLRFEREATVAGVKNRYQGFNDIRNVLKARDHSLPTGMRVEAVDDHGEGVTVQGRAEIPIKLRITIPPDAEPGTVLPVNIYAFGENDVLAGGVTFLFEIEGGS